MDESNKQAAGSHTPGPWKVGESADNGLPCVDGIDPKDGSLFEICEVWGEENDLEITEMSIANARRIVACVNRLAPFTTEQIENGIDLVDLVKQSNDLAAKVADLELALFAENQKRADVERERDQLLSALKSAKHMLERDYIDDAKMLVVEQCDAAIEAVKGGAE